MNKIEIIEQLGKEGTDKITNFKGVISSVSFDLYGCAQYWLTPKANKDMIIPEGKWMDHGRIKLGKRIVSIEEVQVDDGDGPESKGPPIR